MTYMASNSYVPFFAVVLLAIAVGSIAEDFAALIGAASSLVSFF